MQILKYFWKWSQKATKKKSKSTYSKLADILFIWKKDSFRLRTEILGYFTCFMNNWKSVSSSHSVPLKRSFFIHEKEFILCFVGCCDCVSVNLLSLLFFYGRVTRAEVSLSRGHFSIRFLNSKPIFDEIASNKLTKTIWSAWKIDFPNFPQIFISIIKLAFFYGCEIKRDIQKSQANTHTTKAENDQAK